MFQILLWYPWKGKKEYVPLRTAYSQDSRYGMQPKAKQSSRAGAAKTRTETVEFVEEKQNLLREKRERERCASRRGGRRALDGDNLRRALKKRDLDGGGPRLGWEKKGETLNAGGVGGLESKVYGD
ncbi:hypothetical protein TNCV_1771031 [Trichonephila clavipes]|nr:hypothetical protein TNCV_1771031 [Trichonephila clavipes]